MTRPDDQLRELVARADALVERHWRVLLGICGPPGVGKSGLAAQLAAAFGPEAVVVPMDGFHLQDSLLAERGRLGHKGAPDTFDANGYGAFLREARRHPELTLYAPAFDRDRELSLACAIPVEPDHRLVVTEGNYLLLDQPEWWEARAQLDECWFLRLDDDVRRHRLLDRHIRHGRTPEAAAAWMELVDEPNARLVAATVERADLVVDADTFPAWMGG